MFAGALILGESLSALAYTGLALMLSGIAVSEFGRCTDF
jgi:drug/metabolite transporter (DMT)-like permease